LDWIGLLLTLLGILLYYIIKIPFSEFLILVGSISMGIGLIKNKT
jgi:hypothetical protein